MTVTTQTKILNRAYCQHLIKRAAGAYQSSASHSSSSPMPTLTTSGPSGSPRGFTASPTPITSGSPPPSKSFTPTLTTSGVQPLAGAGHPLAGAGGIRGNNEPSIVGSFFNGMGQGAKNLGSGVVNFVPATANFAVPAVAGGLAQLSPHEDVRALGQDWLRQSGAGAKDMAGSLGQAIGVSEAPQNVAQHRQMVQQKYFSNPKDRDLSLGYDGVNLMSDAAAKTIPAVATGQAVLGAAAKVPQLAQAGNAIKTTIEGNKVLSPLMRGTSIATGMPLHPGALQGGTAAATAASQIGQQVLPPLAAGTLNNFAQSPISGVNSPSEFAAAQSNRQFAGQAAQTIANAQPYLPSVAVDNAMRQIHPDAPEYLDYVTMPSVGKSTAGLKAVADLAQPANDSVTQQQQQRQQTQTEQAQTLDDAQQQYGEVFNQAASEGLSKTYGKKLQDLQANNATPDQLNATLDEYLLDASKAKNMSHEQYATLKSQVDNFRQSVGSLPEEEKQQIAAATQNPDSPTGRAVRERGAKSAGNNAVNAAVNNPDVPKPENPQDFGTWAQQTFSSAAESFGKMDPMSQIAMSVGLGAGVLGLLGGMGGGGIGSFLLGALGLGAAGFMGANAGMFGQDAQNFAQDTMFNIGAATGMIPQVKKDELAPLLAKNPMEALSKQAPQIDYAAAALNPAGYAKTIGPQIQQAEAQLGKLQQMVRLRPEQLVQITPGLSVQDAQAAINNAKTVLADAQNPQGRFGSQLAMAREFVANPVAVRDREMQKKLGPVAAAVGTAAGQAMQTGRDYISGLFKRSSDMDIAQKIMIEELITKSARCWAGYEPVPGKKPYSEDSCRPVGSKKKKKKPATKK